MNPIEAAKQKANQLPRPLTDEQQARVDAQRERTAIKLQSLEAAYAKPRTKQSNDTLKVSKQGRNGWTR